MVQHHQGHEELEMTISPFPPARNWGTIAPSPQVMNMMNSFVLTGSYLPGVIQAKEMFYKWKALVRAQKVLMHIGIFMYATYLFQQVLSVSLESKEASRWQSQSIAKGHCCM